MSNTRFCPKCQSETERTPRGDCKPCNRAASAAWKLANPEKYKTIKAAYCAANKEKIRDYDAKRIASHRDERRAQSAEWREKNPEKALAGQVRYRATNRELLRERAAKSRAANLEKRRKQDAIRRAANPEKSRASVAKWAASNPEKIRINKHNRRARKLASGGKLSPNLAARLLKLQRGKCACCGEPLGDNYHLDHIMPLALGGTNTDDNIQLLRDVCNFQKHMKHPVDFMQSRGFLL